MGILILAVVVVLLIMWFISVQRKLVVMDENINNSMSQIGVQLSSRWDALTALLDLTKGYAEHEYKTISDTIKMRTSINAKSTAADVNAQENMLTEAMGKIMAVAEGYPELKANENYIKTMDSVNSYEEMVRKSRLVYNDSVTKLNRAIRMFPTSIAAGVLGIKSRDYLEAEETVINELNEIGKPYIVLLNSATPGSDTNLELANKYNLSVNELKSLIEDNLYNICSLSLNTLVSLVPVLNIIASSSELDK